MNTKPDDEPVPEDGSPEAVLSKRGLKRSGKYYVVPTEFEFASVWRGVVPFYNLMDTARAELMQALQVVAYVRDLDDTRINLINFIQDLNLAMGGASRDQRAVLQNQLREANFNLNNVVAELAKARTRLVSPAKMQQLQDVFMKRREDFLAKSSEVRPIRQKMKAEYDRLKTDDDVVNALKVLKERKKVNVSLGPSDVYNRLRDSSPRPRRRCRSIPTPIAARRSQRGSRRRRKATLEPCPPRALPRSNDRQAASSGMTDQGESSRPLLHSLARLARWRRILGRSRHSETPSLADRDALHPTDQILRARGLGQLDAPSADSVEQHLKSCRGCRQRLDELTSASFPDRLHDARVRLDSPAPVGSSSGGRAKLDGGARSPTPPATETLPPDLAENPDYEVLGELGAAGWASSTSPGTGSWAARRS